jgi:UDP-2,3-diacylglucosamine pyrophosphatase LpxH
MREFTGLRFGGISVERNAIHRMTDGRRFLVMHGDELDVVTTQARWLAHLGHTAYGLALLGNRWFNWWRRKLGYPYWSLSAYLKQRVKNAVGFVHGFTDGVVELARREHVEGVVCGHIHKAELRELGGIQYCNTGDWVESCTALVEHLDGRLEILEWAEIRQHDMLAVHA